MTTSALSAWFLAELRLARVSIKASEAQLKIEAELKRALERLVSQVINEIAASMAAAGAYPATPGITQSIIDGIADKVADAMSESGKKAALMEAREVTGNERFKLEDFSPAVSSRLEAEAFREASQRTLDRVSGNVNRALTEAYEQGLGIDAAADGLRSVFNDMKGYELERIARTEINAAQNAVAAMTIAELGLNYHQWIATLDDRVRESHEELHGTIVRVGDPFPNGLMYPGDTNGDPEEFINCRCRIRPYIFPEGKMPPPGEPYFTEDDLIDRPEVDETRVVEPEPALEIPEAFGPNTVEGTTERWFEYDYGNAIKEVSKGNPIPDVSVGGHKFTDDEKLQITNDAKVLQELAENTVTPYNTVYRGMSMDEDTFHNLFPDTGGTFKTDSLTAVSPQKGIAEIYTDPQFSGLDDARGVMLTIQNPTGIRGHDRSDAMSEAGEEVVLPKGQEYVMTTKFEDDDGVWHVFLKAVDDEDDFLTF